MPDNAMARTFRDLAGAAHQRLAEICTEVHFVVEVQFSIARGDDSCTKKPPHVADMEVVMVCRVQAKRRSRL